MHLFLRPLKEPIKTDRINDANKKEIAIDLFFIYLFID